MRLSDTRLCQLVEADSPRLVLLDETTGAEVTLDRAEVTALVYAIGYFGPAMGLSTGLPTAVDTPVQRVGHHITSHEAGYCRTFCEGQLVTVRCAKHQELAPGTLA